MLLIDSSTRVVPADKTHILTFEIQGIFKPNNQF